MQNLPLHSQQLMPTVGLGTWRAEPGLVGAAVEAAVGKYGYRHVDCAAIYQNEPEIGVAFQNLFKTGIKREELFITSKLWNTEHHPDNVEAACQKTLADLQLDYLDLYLIHWGIPFAHGSEKKPIGDDGIIKTEAVSLQQTWQAMEALVEKGLVKNIGISNFTAPMILDLLTYAKILPAVNQIEIHPYNSQVALVEYCQKKGIQVTAYSPLGSAKEDHAKPLNDTTILDIAKTHEKTPAQVLIRWGVQRGLILIPKSTHEKRIAENIAVFDFELTDEEMSRIHQLNENYRFVDPSEQWGIPYFS